MKRTGLYVPCIVIHLIDAYATRRGLSRNKAIEELMLHTLAPELLEVRAEFVQQAIDKVRKDSEVIDGKW